MARVGFTKCFAPQKQRTKPRLPRALLLPPQNCKKGPKVRLGLRVKMLVTLVH